MTAIPSSIVKTNCYYMGHSGASTTFKSATREREPVMQFFFLTFEWLIFLLIWYISKFLRQSEYPLRVYIHPSKFYFQVCPFKDMHICIHIYVCIIFLYHLSLYLSLLNNIECIILCCVSQRQSSSLSSRRSWACNLTRLVTTVNNLLTVLYYYSILIGKAKNVYRLLDPSVEQPA